MPPATTKTSGAGVGFDPKIFKVTEQRTFVDLTVGEVFRSPSRTVTDAHFAAFQVISGDNHPIHYDREYCRRHGYPDLLAHGFQVLIQTAAGAGLFPFLVEDSLIGFIEQSSRFLIRYLCTPSMTSSRFWLCTVEASARTPVVRWGFSSLTFSCG